MNIVSIVITFITSAFSGIATKLFFKKTSDSTNIVIKDNKKVKIRKNIFLGNVKILKNEDTIINNNEVK